MGTVWVVLFTILAILDSVCAVVDFLNGRFLWGALMSIAAIMCAISLVDAVRKS
jgi:hypothetical protein